MSKIGGTGAPISPGRLTVMALRAGHFAASRLRASGDFLLLPIGGQHVLAMPPECGHAWSTAADPQMPRRAPVRRASGGFLLLPTARPTGGQRALAMFSELMPTPAPRPVGAYPSRSQ